MTTVILTVTRGDDLKIAIDALGATTIHLVTPLHIKGEYLVIYS